MNFRARVDMFVAFPKQQLAAYRDLTMPRRDWRRYDRPACERLKARSVLAREFGNERTAIGRVA